MKSRLSVLGTQFAQNLLADERDWAMALTEDDLAGLPDFVIATARAAGEEKGAGGPVVTLSRSLIVPFLQFSPRRDLRQRAYEAWVARGANGRRDRQPRASPPRCCVCAQERAKLLGYDNFADLQAGDRDGRHAATPCATLLMEVWEPARARALADAEVLAADAAGDGVDGPLEAWDWRYYSERRRKART